MEIKFSKKREGLDVNKQVFQCYICDKLFNWNKESMWYGSDWQVENKPERIKYFCSEKCISAWRNNKNNNYENTERTDN